MNVKKSIMTVLWRVQQAQMVISIIFWSLTLTGIFYPYIRVRALNDLIGPERVFLGMALIFLGVVAMVLAFGYLYDRLKFWREQITVAQERNPFSYGARVTPIQVILWTALLNPHDEEAYHDAMQLLDHNLRDQKASEAYSQIIAEIGGLNES
jgi:hypothetical protein